jgi:hypothetical protein
MKIMPAIIGVYLVACVCSCSVPNTNHNDSPLNNLRLSDRKDTASTNWIYEKKLDKMSGDTLFFASNVAREKVQLPFPYDGGSTVYLTIRNTKGEYYEYLYVMHGTFRTEFEDDQYWRVKFDDEEPSTFRTSEPAGNDDHQMVFLEPEVKFIEKIKKSEMLLVEAHFRLAGKKIVEFNIAGLDSTFFSKRDKSRIQYKEFQ